MDHEQIPKTVEYLHPETNSWKLAKSDICIHEYLGDRIDLHWNINQGRLRISKSIQK